MESLFPVISPFLPGKGHHGLEGILTISTTLSTNSHIDPLHPSGPSEEEDIMVDADIAINTSMTTCGTMKAGEVT